MPDDQTPVDDGSDEGTPATDDSQVVEKLEALQKQLEENQKRIAGQTRSWQEQKARADQLESKLARYEKYGDILDDLSDDDDGNDQPNHRQPSNQPDPNSQQMANMRLQLIETRFIANPENKDKAHIVADPKLKQMAIQEAGNALKKEQTEYGAQQSTDDELFAKGVAAVAEFVDTLKADGARVVEEERHQMPGNVNLSKRGPSRGNVKTDDVEEDGGFIAHSDAETEGFLEEYMSERTNRQNKLRSGG